MYSFIYITLRNILCWHELRKAQKEKVGALLCLLCLCDDKLPNMQF